MLRTEILLVLCGVAFVDANDCVEGTQTWVNCDGYKQCLDGKTRDFICNAGFQVHKAGDGKLACKHPHQDHIGDDFGECFQHECLNNDPDYVIPIDCNHFYGCLHHQKVRKTCPDGKVHDGVSPYCVSADSLQSSHKCYSSECTEGTVYPIDCDSFRSCIGGKMRSVFCKTGLVHDGQANKCVKLNELPAGHKCHPAPTTTAASARPTLPPLCVEGTIKPVSCNSFEICADGLFRQVFCAPGSVHVGFEAECIRQEQLVCGTKCAASCPVEVCKAGDVLHIDCNSFYLCIDNQWVSTHCEAGKVHANANLAQCVDKSSLQCDSVCAPACAVIPVVDICERGAIEQIDCSSFNYCLGDRWVTKYCSEGLVMAAPDQAQCVSPKSLPCGSTCAQDCCISGSIIPLDCQSFKLCVNGEWKSSTCNDGLVHADPLVAQCFSPNVLACDSRCAPACTTPAPATTTAPPPPAGDVTDEEEYEHDMLGHYVHVESISCVKYLFCYGHTHSNDPSQHRCDEVDCNPGFVHLVGQQGNFLFCKRKVVALSCSSRKSPPRHKASFDTN
ncbi:Oidioi.mRNA.OKI2018_I69.XSR.g13882.t1.cds [Oikopleura dioica]|uniref:chitinase n=1 Tax=Oikopleura dioica TaxID=34765 RepID=A0ABN7SCY5_OIKDI|nr:Oidioi.mRNA.OKI2018_I69.XSR.g13882.t1.cds [Oikopleura dioica]